MGLKIWKRLLIVVGLSLLAYAIYLASTYTDNETSEIKSTQFPSPDGSRIATVRVNAYGWPFTSGYFSTVVLEGGPDKMPRTYILALRQYRRDVGLTAHWLSPTRLELTFDGNAVIDSQADHEEEIVITVRDLSAGGASLR